MVEHSMIMRDGVSWNRTFPLMLRKLEGERMEGEVRKRGGREQGQHGEVESEVGGATLLTQPQTTSQ